MGAAGGDRWARARWGGAMTLSPPHAPITLATRITILRILGIPLFILILIYYKMSLAAAEPVEWYRHLALGLFVLIAVTDALDGYLARKRDEESRLGAILDPLADKALLLSAIILLTNPTLDALQPQFPISFTLLIISRDVVLLSGSYIIHTVVGHVDVRPRMSGKVATFLQMAAIIAALIPLSLAFPWIVGAAAAFTLISWLQYIFDGVRQLERHEAE